MSSSGGSYSGPISSPVGPAIPNLPIAGKDSAVGDPYEYGKFQSFLPDAKASGPNDMATGLRPEMFQYKSPSGVVAQSDTVGQVQGLRDQLAQIQATQQQQIQQQQQPQFFGPSSQELTWNNQANMGSA